jgi:NTE family protein
VSRVGLVLGGGGITGAAYEMAALMTLRLATGWEPNDSAVVVGTSGGSFVAALVRHDALSLDSLVLPSDDREAVTERIRRHVFTKDPGVRVGKWVRHGIVPGIRNPGVTLFLGSPAPYHASGLARWVATQVGDENAAAWPKKPTAVVAYDLIKRSRVIFGTSAAPDVAIADAVAASSAIPVVFRPYPLADSLYVDGGVASGTHADLVLGSSRPLDLVLVLAPLVSETHRMRARVHEKMFDRVGQRSLTAEIRLIKDAWPGCEVVVLSPTPSVQNALRPNPMDASRAVATFTRTLISMKRSLARPEVWEVLDHHLTRRTRARSAASR